MSVYHDKKGDRWRYNFKYKKKRYSRGFKTEAEAIKRETELKSSLKHGSGETERDEEIGTEYKGEVHEEDTSINGSKIIFSSSIKITTVEELLAYSKIDVDKYDIERIKVNKWDVTLKIKQPDGTHKPETHINHQIKVWLKPKIIEPMKVAIENLIKEIPKFEPTHFRLRAPRGKFAMECSYVDVHSGKLAWGEETGQGDYDSDIAMKNYLEIAERNLSDCTRVTDDRISKIFIIIGQDFFHVENLKEETPFGGNKLDVDTRLPLIFQKGKETVIKVGYMYRDVAKVEFIWVPGNHDPMISYFLCHVLKEHFRKDKHVSVDISPQWRKARMWGNLLVGFSHDAEGRKLEATVNMLPQYFPEEWGRSKFREWHVGHLHKKGEKKFAPTQTIGGTVVRRIAALSKIDAWHYQHGFVDAVPGGESFVWTEDRGIKTVNTEYILD